jgi:hypothetical protein
MITCLYAQTKKSFECLRKSLSHTRNRRGRLREKKLTCRELGLLNSTIEIIWKFRSKICSTYEWNESRIKWFRKSEWSDVKEAVPKFLASQKWQRTSKRTISHCSFCTSKVWPASWSSGLSFWLLIMRSRVRFPALPWEGEDSHGDHGLGSLVELRFKAPPGTSYSYITIHLIGTT